MKDDGLIVLITKDGWFKWIQRPKGIGRTLYMAFANPLEALSFKREPLSQQGMHCKCFTQVGRNSWEEV